MATIKQPEGVSPPKCACGCGGDVKWKPGVGWLQYSGRGHALRGRPNWKAGTTTSPETKERQRKAALARYAGKRLRDVEPVPGAGVYSSHEYKEAREKLKGRPCVLCGKTEDISAHHMVPGDDATLIPLCRSCHAIVHKSHARVRRNDPPIEEKAPLCACGCGQPTKWKRVRGWAKYARGHGNAKVPAVHLLENAPTCKCGCGEQTAFRHGVGWNEYKRGHRQRDLGTSYLELSKLKKAEAVQTGH